MGDIVEELRKWWYKYEISQKGLFSRVIEKETAGHKKILFSKMAPGNIENMVDLSCQKFERIKTWYKNILEVKF